MKNNLIFGLKIIFVSLLSLSVYAEAVQTIEKDPLIANQKKNDIDTRTGLISSQELVNEYAGFKQSYADFQPHLDDVKSLKLLAGMDVVIFMGLWCHDSEREVPRLIKLIEQAEHPFKSVKIVALNTKKELSDEYKDKFEVTHTPTIFVLKDDKILATIIESPEGTIAEDLISQIMH